MNLQSLKAVKKMKKVDKSMEKSTKSTNTFCRNKPNSPIVQMNASLFITMIYTIFASLTKVKNKPNQTQFKPIKAKTNPIQTQLKPKQTQSSLSSNVEVGGPISKAHKHTGIINAVPGFVNLIKSAAVTLSNPCNKEIYVMKLQSIVLAVLSGFLVFTYQPPRPPILDPDTVPFHYDPNLCQSEPLGYAVIIAGTTYKNNFKVTEPEGSPVTISITTGQNIVIEPKPYVNLFDPNDSQGKCKIYRYRWSWATTAIDIGLHYVNVHVTDTGGAYDERTFLVLVKENRPPVGIMGCHRR